MLPLAHRSLIGAAHLRGLTFAVLCIVSALLVPALNPVHVEPVGPFLMEWMAAVAIIGGAFAIHLQHRRRIEGAPAPLLLLLAFGAYVLVLTTLNPVAYPEQSLIGALYVFLMVLAIWFGAVVARGLGRTTLSAIIAWALVAGAAANVGFAILQYYDLRHGPWSVITLFGPSQPPGSRAYGNVANPNLLALQLMLGVLSLAYLRSVGRAGVALLSTFVVLFAVGLTLAAARWSLLAFIAILLLAVWSSRRGDPRLRIMRNGILAAFLAFVFVSVAADRLGVGPTQSTWNRVASVGGEGLTGSSGIRFYLWRHAIEMIERAPLLGHGFGSYRGQMFAQVGRIPEPVPPGLDPNAHNIVLHLTAETGLLGLALVALALGPIALSLLRRNQRPRTIWALGAIGIFAIHSLLESPLWYANFLVVFSLVLAVDVAGRRARGGAKRRSDLTRELPGRAGSVLYPALVAIGVVASVHLFFEWRRTTAMYTAARSPAGTSAWLAENDVDSKAWRRGLFRPRRDHVLLTMAPPGALLPEAALVETGRMLEFLPSTTVLIHRIDALWRLGRRAEAGELADKYCTVFPEQIPRFMAILLERHGAGDTQWDELIVRLGTRDGSVTPQRP